MRINSIFAETKKTVMQKIVTKISLLALSLMCFSCIPIGTWEEEIDMGYPNTVTFSNEGGEQIVAGSTFANAEIHGTSDPRHRDRGYQDADSTIYSEFDWLRVEHKENSPCSLKIIAQPNTTGKTRKLYIRTYSAYDYQEITVKQSR
jgi:hypothetical protein